MGKSKMTQDTVAECVYLNRQGKSYRSIARRLGFDPRTVKAWIQKANEVAEGAHWEAVARQVDVKYLDHHYRMLVQVATAVLDALETDPITTHHELPADRLLNQCVQSRLETSLVYISTRSLDNGPASGQPVLTSDTIVRLGSRLLEALAEHEPQLGKAIEKWENAWSEFRKQQLELLQVATNLFKLDARDEDLAMTLKQPVVQESLQTRLLGREPCSLSIEEHNDEQVFLLAGRPGTMTRIHRGSKPECMAARDAYAKTLKQVSHEERIKPVRAAYHDLKRCTSNTQELADQLILIGRPQGQCSICFNRVTR